MPTEHGSIGRLIKGAVGSLPVGAVLLLLGLLTLVPSAQGAVAIESFTAETSSTLAGAHADATTAFAFKTLFPPGGEPTPIGGSPSEVVVTIPPGLVADLNNAPRCPRSRFALGSVSQPGGGCPADTQVGTAKLTIGAAGVGTVSEQTLGVYDVQPNADQPGLLGIQGIPNNATSVTIPIVVTANAKDNYRITATVPEVPQYPLVQAGALASSVTLWAVPAAHVRGSGRSDFLNSRESSPDIEEELPPAPRSQWKPFMENPTDCFETPTTTLAVNTIQEPQTYATATALSPNATGCADVPFAPSISLAPETSQVGAPTGINVDVTVPQSNAPEVRGTSELEKAVVTLPAGMTISPSAASNLLEGCTDEQFGAGSDTPAQCPAASSIGEDEVESPLLPQPSMGGEGKLSGKVYLGQPLSTDPGSGRMFRIFQELRGFGLDVKLGGSVTANPQTGQLTATFEDIPELPFQTFRMHLRGGPNAVLVNPPMCGTQTTTSKLYPYSGNPPATPSATFNTSYNGGPCPPNLPFSVSSAVASARSQAGTLSPLSLTFSRGDQTQPLGQIDATLPQGLLGFVSKVALCEAAAAMEGTCGPESRIGNVATSAGAGPDPLTVTGSVYLARGTNGYPFMLSVVVPAVAGPYNLGNVVVPVYLQVNSDGSITAVSDQLPSILDGIPLDIRAITMTLDRPGFTVNPTNCGPLSLSGTATSLSGATSPLSAPFSVTGCTSLPFAPSFTAVTQGSSSRQYGASLGVRVSQKPGEADIRSVHVELPKSLPSRLSTLQKACTAQQFAANPADCPPGSIVGTAVAYTPLLPVPVTGPAILVSHAGAAFPDLDIILQGDGITIDLVGNTDIRKGITSSTFASVPDVPISGFELNLPEGPYSIFAANGNLCEQKLLMPTTITAQNGVTLTQKTSIAVTGCKDTKPSVTVVKAKAKASSLMVTLKTTAAGTVKLSGAGLDTKNKKNVKAGTSQIEVSLSKTGRSMAERHEKLKLHASLRAGKVAAAKTTRVQL
jgi:hypothetical protein